MLANRNPAKVCRVHESHIIRILSVDTAVKCDPGEDTLVKGVQCYVLFRCMELKNHAFVFLMRYLNGIQPILNIG